jgi:hypothetical protein
MPNIPLLDRYLQFTANFLPTRGRQDILAELRANLQSEMDDRAESLGRPLTEDEIALLLKQHGHPMIVATRYLPQQFLIGPTWIASYWFTLKISLAVAATFTLAASLLSVLLDRASVGSLLAHWLGFANTALTVFAWVTLSFILLDFCVRKYGPTPAHEITNWDPRKLPAVTLSGSPVSRQKPVSDFIGALVGLLILVAFARHWSSFVPANILQTLRFSHAWRPFYEICLATAFVRLIATFTRLLRPDWKILQPLSNIMIYIGSFAAFQQMFVNGPWIMLQPGQQYLPALGIANTIIFWCVTGGLVFNAIALIVEIWRSVKLFRNSHSDGSGDNGNSAASTPLSC